MSQVLVINIAAVSGLMTALVASEIGTTGMTTVGIGMLAFMFVMAMWAGRREFRVTAEVNN